MGRVLNGDEPTLDLFARRIAFVPRLLAIRNAKMGRPLTADELQDVCQETFVVVLRRLREYLPLAPLESWIHGICLLQLQDAVRAKMRRRARAAEFDPDTPAEQPTPASTVVELAEVQRLLVELGGIEAQVVRLKHLEGLTFAETAERLRISVNTAKTMHYRGLQRLRASHHLPPPTEPES